MNSIFIRFLLFSWIIFFGVSCGLLEKAVEKPKVNIESLNLKDVSGAGATLVFGLKVDNPNPFTLKVDGLKYHIQIGEREISKGAIDKLAALKAKQSSLIEIPISVKYEDIFASISDLLINGSRPYTIDGSVQLGILSVPFEHSGHIEFRSLMK